MLTSIRTIVALCLPLVALTSHDVITQQIIELTVPGRDVIQAGGGVLRTATYSTDHVLVLSTNKTFVGTPDEAMALQLGMFKDLFDRYNLTHDRSFIVTQLFHPHINYQRLPYRPIRLA